MSRHATRALNACLALRPGGDAARPCVRLFPLLLVTVKLIVVVVLFAGYQEYTSRVEKATAETRGGTAASSRRYR